MDALLPEEIAGWLQGKEVVLWMMSCGRLVSNGDSYKELAAEASRQVALLLSTTRQALTQF
jgi:hypothetical protein